MKDLSQKKKKNTMLENLLCEIFFYWFDKKGKFYDVIPIFFLRFENKKWHNFKSKMSGVWYKKTYINDLMIVWWRPLMDLIFLRQFNKFNIWELLHEFWCYLIPIPIEIQILSNILGFSNSLVDNEIQRPFHFRFYF